MSGEDLERVRRGSIESQKKFQKLSGVGPERVRRASREIQERLKRE